MSLTTERLSFAEYLRYDDGTDTRYELVKGERVPMSPGTGQHAALIHCAERTSDAEITRQGLPWIALQTAIGVRSPRGGRWDTVRIPDVVVLPLEQWRTPQNREAVINPNEPPPLLVVEVVSESTQQTDYRAKQAEYNVLNIPEYWIVDPLENKITVLTLIDEGYDLAEFKGTETIQLTIFPELVLTAEQLLSGNIS